MQKKEKEKRDLERISVAFRCPKCRYYAVATPLKTTVRKNRDNGSKADPFREYCPNSSGKCSCKGGGRGKRLIRLVSVNNRHAIARLSIRQKNRLDALVATLNERMDEDEDYNPSNAEYYSILDPSWVAGMEPPLAFRWERDI